MNNFRKFYLFSAAGVFLASFYPLLMGVRVVRDVIRDGMVMQENYPKYIIPYTPISLAVIIAVLLMPVLMKYTGKYALAAASSISFASFFTLELLLEKVVIASTMTIQFADTTVPSTIKLENWQMFMCYVPPQSVLTRSWTPVNVLIGEYSPAFKLHFYIISLVLIIALLNSFYGFAKMILTQNKQRLKALVIQSVCAGLFLGLCIFACFTAFFRDGEITVSPLSAVLMSVFFIVFGITAGVFTGSLMIQKQKILSVFMPSIVASVVTLIMYIGEMILLSGHLYRFGPGFFFDGLPGIVLAPVDILVILAAGFINAVLCNAFNKKQANREAGYNVEETNSPGIL